MTEIINDEANNASPKSTELTQLIQGSGLEPTKQNAIAQTLDSFFSQALEWDGKIQQIVITSPTETDKMAIARESRLTLKSSRLEAMKLITSKRDEVKFRMNNDVLEDKLWLKAGQMIEATFKNLETKLEEKEKFKELYEAKERERIKGVRLQEIMEYSEFIPSTIDFGVLNQEDYDKILSSAKAAKQQKEENEAKAIREQQEKELKDKIRVSRERTLRPFQQFFDYDNLPDLGEMEDVKFEDYYVSLQTAKKSFDDKQEEIIKENERMRKESEEKERALAAEREAAAEALRIETEYREARLKEEREAAAKLQREQELKAQKEREEMELELKAEREAKEKIERELEEKRIAEEKAIKEAQEAKEREAKEKAAAEKKAAKAPDKTKLIALAMKIESIEAPQLTSDEAKAILSDVNVLVAKLVKFINDKAKTL